MKKNHQNIQQKAAILSAVALLIMTLAAFFSQGYVHSSLVVSEDAATTLKNIQASHSLFNLEILGWIIIFLTDLIVSWGFYVFLKPYHYNYALLAGLLRLLYTAILAIAVSNLVIASRNVQGMKTATPHQVMDSITAFGTIWSLGLIIFGLHLISVGLAAMKTKQIPKTISILLVLAGFSYALIHAMYGFIPQLDHVTSVLEIILMAPMFVGELGFGIWLLVKGRKLTTI